MCDTLVIPGQLFAKNSDREIDEAQQVVTLPSADHAPGGVIVCTYVRIPQVTHTHALLLSKPFWLWGAEMGANEHGLVIGNEALFTDLPPEKQETQDGLIGMDLLRLALERAATAEEAVVVITDLLAAWGQAGNCGYRTDFRYDNSFLIADARDAWVLETAGRDWVAKRVSQPRSISNAATLGTEWDRGSAGVDAGGNFAATVTDIERTIRSNGMGRCQRTQSLLDDAGMATPAAMMGFLRDHGSDSSAEIWHPTTASERTVCMHVCAAPISISQTTGSMVSMLGAANGPHFLTGAATPCTGIFLPLWIDCALPSARTQPTGTPDQNTLFWQHERMLGAILADYPTRNPEWQEARESIETPLIERALALRDAPRLERQHLVDEAIETAFATYQSFADQWRSN